MAGENITLSPDATNINVTSMTGSTEQYPALVEAIKSAIDKVDKAKDPKNKEERNKLYRLLQKTHNVINGDFDLSENHMKMTQGKFDEAIKQGKDTAAKIAKFANGITLAYETIKQIAVPVINETKKRMNWLSELEKSGVHLAEGFDESFTDLANTAKMSHDSFVRMLSANSRQIAKLNAVGLNGARTFSNALNKTVGKFGYTTDEASTALSSYMENIVGFYSKETLAEKLKSNATTAYLKNLKELSAATGKSVDILTQENQLKEDTLFAKKLNAQNPALYGTLKQAGLSDSQIKALVTGRPNDASVMANFTPEGRAVWSQFEKLTRGSLKGTISNEELIQEVGNLLKSDAVERGRKRLENMDWSMAGVLSESQGHNEGLGFVPGLAKFNTFSAKTVGNNEGDTAIVNSLNDYLAEIDKLQNNWNKALSFSALNASRALGIFGWGLDKVNKVMGTFVGTAIAWSFMFGKTKGGIFAFSKIFKGLRGGFNALGDNRFKGTLVEKFFKGMFGSKHKTLVNIFSHPLKSINNGLLSIGKTLASGSKTLGMTILKATARLSLLAGIGFATYFGFKKLFDWTSSIGESLGGGKKGLLAGAGVGLVGGAGIGALAGALLGSLVFPGLGTAAGAAIGAAIGGAVGGVGGAITGYGKGPASSVSYTNEYSYVQEQDVQKSKVQNETLTELKTMNTYIKNTSYNTKEMCSIADKDSKNRELDSLNYNNALSFSYAT